MINRYLFSAQPPEPQPNVASLRSETRRTCSKASIKSAENKTRALLEHIYSGSTMHKYNYSISVPGPMKKTGGNPPKFHQVEVVMVEVPKRPGRHGKKMGGQSLFWRQASASVVSVHVELVLANWMHPKLALKTAEATQNDHGASSGCRRMNFAGAAPRPTRKFRM